STFSTSSLSAGTHLITASYGGDPFSNGGTSGILTQIIKAVPTIAVSSSPNPSAFGQTVTFTAIVSPSSAIGMVAFVDGLNGPLVKVMGSGSLSSGKATFSISSLSVGTHSITARYGGDGNNN